MDKKQQEAEYPFCSRTQNFESKMESNGLCANFSDYYETGTCLITWVFLPFICMIGFVLNLLAITTFSYAIYRGQRTSMTVYLIALSAFDSIQLLLSIFIITFGGSYLLTDGNGQLAVNPDTLDTINIIRIYATVYFYPVLMTANYGSVWVITLICVQRYFAICFPLSSLRTVELKRATTEVIFISAAACALNVCRFWEFSLDYETMDPITNHSSDRPLIGMGPFRNPADHPYYLMAMDGVLYIVLLYFLPFMIVSILNVKIVMVIYTARRTMKSSRSSGGGGVSHHHRSEHRSALMVLAIILLFFICYTLAVAERLWSIIDTLGAVSKFGGFLNAVSNLMVNLNSTVDPLIYFLFSRGFKEVCLKMRKKKYRNLERSVGSRNASNINHSRRSQSSCRQSSVNHSGEQNSQVQHRQATNPARRLSSNNHLTVSFKPLVGDLSKEHQLTINNNNTYNNNYSPETTTTKQTTTNPSALETTATTNISLFPINNHVSVSQLCSSSYFVPPSTSSSISASVIQNTTTETMTMISSPNDDGESEYDNNAKEIR